MSIRRTFMAVLIVFIGLSSAAYCSGEPTAQVRVYFEDGAVLRLLEMSGYDVVYRAESEGWADVFAASDDLQRLRQAGYQLEIIHEDVSEFYRSRLDADKDMGGYKTLSEMYAYLDDMIAAHSDIMADKISIGQSIEGRELYAVKISDNPDVDEDEPELFFNAMTHGCEVVPGEILLYFMNYLTDNYGVDPEATDIVENRELWFVLVVNPDGLYYNETTDPDGGGVWRKNRRDNPDNSYGVDLNRNFGFMWGYDDVGSSPVYDNKNYRGEAPFSEPECQAMRDFIASRNFVLEVDYHSYGNLVMYPYGYDLYRTPDHELFKILADSMSSYNNYSVIQLPISNGCSADWSYGEQSIKPKILDFGLEVGTSEDGFWPDMTRLAEMVTENLGLNLFLCRAADICHTWASPVRPSIIGPSSTQGSEYTVYWTHSDADNPATAYELVEYQGPVTTVDSANDVEGWVTDAFFPSTSEYHSPPTSFSTYYANSYIETEAPVYCAAADILTFWIKYDLSDGYSYAYVEVSTDGFSYERLSGNITTTENPSGYNRGNGITGDSDGWVEGIFDLSAYEGETIFIRFSCYRLMGVPGPPAGNCYFDDIVLRNQYSVQTVIASDITDTFYVFDGKTEGEYYYTVRARDAENQYSQYSMYKKIVVTAGGTCCVLRGDFDHNGTVDPMDAVAYTNWMYRGGPPAVCDEEADVNGNGSIDPFDLLYLIDYLWRGGPPPPPC